MKLSDLTDVLTFRAFRPDPDDSSAPICRRLIGKRYLCLNINKDRVSWRQVDRKGNFGQGGVVQGQFKEVLSQMAEEWKGMTDGGWVVVSINNRFFITLETNMSRKPGSEVTIRSNARSVIGAKFDRTKKYAIHHNPETSASMLLSCEETLVKSIEDTLSQSGFQAARICCGLFAMVEDYVRREHEARKGGKGKDFTLIACCDGSVLVLAQKGGQWTELRSRAGLYGDAESGGESFVKVESETDPVMNIAGPVLNGADPSSALVLIHDRMETDFSRKLAEQLSNQKPVDITQDEHLWMVLTQN